MISPQNPKIARVTRSRQQVQAYYDRLSRWYDLLSGAVERKYIQMGLELLDLHPGEAVLEIGFGAGHGLLALARRTGCVTGLDLSLGMAKIARARLERHGALQHASLCCGDGLDLPIAAASLEAVFLSFTLELFDTPHIPLALAECRRVLKPGGRLGVVALSKPSHLQRGVAVYECLHSRFPQALDCRPISVQRCLEEAGFAIALRLQPALLGILPLEVILAYK